MNKVVKSTLAFAATAATLASVVATPSLVSAWGDNGGGRKSYTIDQINSGVLGNKIVFNSISDSVIGDEKNFVGARENTGINAGVDNRWNGNDITVENGKEYLVRLYVHNNNPNGYDAVSQNTRVAFNIPTYSAKQIQVNGFIFSDNATPSEYWDYVNFNSDQAFHLEYVYGSALIENNGYASKENGGAKKLGDEIVTKAASENGVRIGFEQAGDGKIPGCYTYANYVTIRVKAVFDTDYKVEQKVRLVGDTNWHDKIEVKVGDKVEYQIMYHNTSKETQSNVMIKDILPNNAKYIDGSTRLYNTNHPNGAIVNQDKVATTGINIGTYLAGANAYVRFTAEIVDKNLQAGSNTLVNWSQAGVGQKVIQDYTSVHLTKAGTTTELPKTGPEALAGSVVAAGSIVTAAGYFIASRRNMR